MAQAAPPRVRTTELRPRKLFDFISPAMLIASALTYVAFIALMAGLAVMFSIAMPVAITALPLVKLLAGPEFLEPVVASLYVQIFGLGILWQSYRHRADKVDFDVYKRDARDSTVVASPAIGSPQAGHS